MPSTGTKIELPNASGKTQIKPADFSPKKNRKKQADEAGADFINQDAGIKSR